ncbi:MAG: LytTR family DNA-binding domain-containing protein [Cyclobacteriaceae bacterium]
MRLIINYDLLGKWKMVLVTTLVIELVYQAIIYLHPENLEWINSEYFSFSNLFQFLFIDQFLIECITVAIIFQLIRFYGNKMKLTELRLNVRELVIYELKFLPVILVAFFFFAPLTLSVRFLYHHYPDLNSVTYFEEYFYSVRLYINYLTPVFLVGFIIINANLIHLYNKQLGQTQQDLNEAKKPKIKSRIWASDEWGELFLDTEKIIWIERESRKSFAQTEGERYRLKENITELEDKLDPDKFIRINRSTIVNLEYVLNYSFWENDKYVLRMRDEKNTEFIMSRERLQKIKHLFLEMNPAD